MELEGTLLSNQVSFLPERLTVRRRAKSSSGIRTLSAHVRQRYCRDRLHCPIPCFPGQEGRVPRGVVEDGGEADTD